MLKRKLKNKVQVTFILPVQGGDETVYLVGDFNSWDERATPLKKLKNGHFTATLELEKGREYQFRYLVNGTEWHNDWHADKYVPNQFGADNSVVVT